MRRRVVLALVCLPLAGCLWSGRQVVDLTRPALPTRAARPTPPAAVRFRLTDDRRSRDEVGFVGTLGSPWMAPGPIVTREPLLPWLEAQLVQQAAARCCEVRDDGVVVHVSVNEVFNRFYPGFWAPVSESSVRLLVRVDDAAGFAVYSRLIEVVKADPNVPAWPELAAKGLSGALADAIASLLDDPELARAVGEVSDARPQPL